MPPCRALKEAVMPVQHGGKAAICSGQPDWKNCTTIRNRSSLPKSKRFSATVGEEACRMAGTISRYLNWRICRGTVEGLSEEHRFCDDHKRVRRAGVLRLCAVPCTAAVRRLSGILAMRRRLNSLGLASCCSTMVARKSRRITICATGARRREIPAALTGPEAGS